MSERGFEHEKPWWWWVQHPRAELVHEVGVTYGPLEDRRQLSVAITRTALGSAPLKGDHDKAKRLILSVLRGEAGAVRDADDAHESGPTDFGYESVEPAPPGLQRCYRKILGPLGPDDHGQWVRFVDQHLSP